MSESSDANGAHDELLSGLADGVNRLGRLVASHPQDAWRWPAGEGWSAHEVLVHLRASSEILTPRVTQMLTRDEPPLPAFDDRAWARVAGYRDMSGDALFARIALPRYELIQTLRRAGDAAWARTGIHERHGRITVAQVVAHIVAHEREHLDQIEALLGGQ